MWPTLISVGPIALHSFGLLLFIGFFLGGFVLWKKGKEEGFAEEKLMDGWLIALVVALLFARVGYILGHYSDFAGSLYKMLFLTKYPGLSTVGGLVGGMSALWLFARVKEWNVYKFGEIVVQAILVVEIYGWLGAFLAGSYLGVPVAWGLPFPGVGKVLPLQLIYLLLTLVLYRLILKWEKTYRTFNWYQHEKDESRPGFLIGVYFIGSGILRIGLDFVKQSKMIRWGLDINQWWGIAMLIIGSLIILSRSGIKLNVGQKTEKANNEPKSSENVNKRKKKGFDFK